MSEGATKEPSVVHIGCAGWNIPAEHAAAFGGEGTHLQRYAARFSCVEINSSFYRSHRTATYARWAASVPTHFRFAVKVPREITHRLRLVHTSEPLARFLAEATVLGDTLGPLLVQLPPRLAFDADSVHAFFGLLRERFSGLVACEPRHGTWFEAEAEQMMLEFAVARVAADPAIVSTASRPGGWRGLTYYRLHGSPRVYYSAYSDEALLGLAGALRNASYVGEVWCIFDNTAAGAATTDALRLAEPRDPLPNP